MPDSALIIPIFAIIILILPPLLTAARVVPLATPLSLIRLSEFTGYECRKASFSRLLCRLIWLALRAGNEQADCSDSRKSDGINKRTIGGRGPPLPKSERNVSGARELPGSISITTDTTLWQQKYDKYSPAVQCPFINSRNLLKGQGLFTGTVGVRRTPLSLSTVGDAVYPVASALTWNSLPQQVTSAPLCLFSQVASRLSSSGVPSHYFYRNFCSACAVTVQLSFLDA